MYCIKCGVRLADGEKQCPLCKTRVYHPDLDLSEKELIYPAEKYPEREKDNKFWPIILTVAFLISFSIVILCDLQINGSVTWSGFAVGALVLGYVVAVLPQWFRKPNPVIFVPCGFFTAGLYLFYIDIASGGGWFLPFALPVTAAVGAIVCAVVTLMRYVSRGRFFIFGGAFLFSGALCFLLELLMTCTFESIRFVGWSFYPLVIFWLLGGFLIFLGICRPARESMERKFFV